MKSRAKVGDRKRWNSTKMRRNGTKGRMIRTGFFVYEAKESFVVVVVVVGCGGG